MKFPDLLLNLISLLFSSAGSSPLPASSFFSHNKILFDFEVLQIPECIIFDPGIHNPLLLIITLAKLNIMKTISQTVNRMRMIIPLKTSISKPGLIFVFSGLIFFNLFSCKTSEEDLERLQEENQVLKDQLETNMENVEAYFADLNQIEENLRIIKEREELISGETSGALELGLSQQDRINQDIMLIGELMEKNRELIASLNNRIRSADQRITGFEQMVARLNQTIEEKEIEIQMLREQLAQMNLQVDLLMARVDTLEQESERKSQLLQEQTLEMNAAWFAMGSRRELIDNNIISREGGFLGIGRTNRLKSDFNKDFFTRIDVTRDFEITIVGENPELITSHHSDSYQIVTEEGETLLRINDPDRFWSASRYLVIQIR